MARTQDPTAFYIRTKEGATFYVDTLDEALEELIGEDGYRLTIASNNKELVIRRNTSWEINPTEENESPATLVYREKDKTTGGVCDVTNKTCLGGSGDHTCEHGNAWNRCIDCGCCCPESFLT